MRKKQVLALLLTGALTVGMAPAAAFAAEDVSVLSIEDLQAADLPVEAASEEPAGEASEEPTEPQEPADTPIDTPETAPSETPTEPTDVPTQAPTDTPAVPSDTPTTAPSETPSQVPAVAAEGNLPADTTATPSPSPSVTPAAGPFTIGETAYATLAEAIAASTATVDGDEDIILINQDLELSETITVSGDKNVTIAAPVGKTIHITRKAGFTGNMFEVKGGILSFGGAIDTLENGNDTNGTLTVNGSGEGTQGSIVAVSEDGMFNLLDYATMTGNSTTANGAAINCSSGLVTVGGGSITGNSTSGEGGAIYSNSTVYVGGTVTISGNTNTSGEANNIVLNNDSTVTDPVSAVTVCVLDKLSGSNIGVKLANPAAGVPAVVVSSDIDGMTVADALSQFTYEDAAFLLDESGALKSAEAPAEELKASITDAKWLSTSRVQITGTSNKDGEAYIKIVKKGSTAPTADQIIAANQKVSVTANKGFTIKHTFTAEEKKEVGTDAITVYVCVKDAATGDTVVASVDMDMAVRPPKVSGVSAAWTGHDSAKIVCISDKAGSYYVEWVKRGDAAPTVDFTKAGSAVAANENFTVYVSDLDPDNAIDVYIYVKGNDGTISAPLLAQLNENSRPASTNPTVTPARSPRTPAVSESKVTGLEEPLEFYPNAFYDFTVIGAGTDNTDPIEGDTRWVPLYWSMKSNPTDADKHSTWKIGSKVGIKTASTFNLFIFFRQDRYNGREWQPTDSIVSQTYQFMAADIEYSLTPTPTAAPGTYYDENGNLVSRTDDTTDTGSTTAGGADTADESPIGTMSMLAVLSLLAGGYVITRKRKKITE